MALMKKHQSPSLVDIIPGSKLKCVFDVPASKTSYQFHLPELTVIEVKPEINAVVIQMQVSAELLGEGVWNAMMQGLTGAANG